MAEGSEKKDDLFQKNLYPRSGFVFDDKVVEVFDDMLHRSIPHYEEVMGISQKFLLDQGPGGILYDLGSSTGNFLLKLASADLSSKYHEYRGIDNSPAMVERAKKKFREARLSPLIRMDFTCGDLLTHDYPVSGGFTLHYTLQFIAPDRRRELLQRLYASLSPGGLLVLSEKVEEGGYRLKDFFIDRYHDFKATNRYTTVEIARKKEALEKVLIPFTTADYDALLHEVGFGEIAIAFKWYNFITWFAIK